LPYKDITAESAPDGGRIVGQSVPTLTRDAPHDTSPMCSGFMFSRRQRLYMTRKKSDNQDPTSEERSASVQGYIRRSIHTFAIESATHYGMKEMEWIDFALGEYIESLGWEDLSPMQRMRREFIVMRRVAEDKKIVRELVRFYLEDKAADKLTRIEEYCDVLGISVKNILEDVAQSQDAAELYEDADIQINHALDWAREYFKGKKSVLSKTVEEDAKTVGINSGTLKEIKSLLEIPSKRGGHGLAFSWILTDSKPLKLFIRVGTKPDFAPSTGFELTEKPVLLD
jgi:hypothetical protein